MLNDDPAGPQYGQKRFCEWLPSELRDALDEAEAECEGKMAELDNAAEPRLGCGGGVWGGCGARRREP